jgi:hypothetical protein
MWSRTRCADAGQQMHDAEACDTVARVPLVGDPVLALQDAERRGLGWHEDSSDIRNLRYAAYRQIRSGNFEAGTTSLSHRRAVRATSCRASRANKALTVSVKDRQKDHNVSNHSLSLLLGDERANKFTSQWFQKRQRNRIRATKF